MPIFNPHNGYVPQVGERVRIIGACHPRALGKVVEVTSVGQDEGDGRLWYGCWFYDAKNPSEKLYSGGDLGGLEPALGCEVDTF